MMDGRQRPLSLTQKKKIATYINKTRLKAELIRADLNIFSLFQTGNENGVTNWIKCFRSNFKLQLQKKGNFDCKMFLDFVTCQLSRVLMMPFFKSEVQRIFPLMFRS